MYSPYRQSPGCLECEHLRRKHFLMFWEQVHLFKRHNHLHRFVLKKSGIASIIYINSLYRYDLDGWTSSIMGLLPDTQNCGLRMRRECRERFPRHQLLRKPRVSDPGMHHGTCITHVPWCMSGSLTRGGVENVPGIPGTCATRNFTYLARGPWLTRSRVNELGHHWLR